MNALSYLTPQPHRIWVSTNSSDFFARKRGSGAFYSPPPHINRYTWKIVES